MNKPLSLSRACAAFLGFHGAMSSLSEQQEMQRSGPTPGRSSAVAPRNHKGRGINMMRRFIWGLAVACLIAWPARADLITNGGFEADPAGTTMATPVTGWSYEGGGDPSLSIILNDAHSISGNYLWLNDFPGPTPTAFQDLTIIPGGPYELTGKYHSHNHNDNGLYALAIRFMDISGTPTVIEELTLPVTSTAPDPANWASFDFTRTFATSALRIEFISQFGGDNDTAIDNISFVGTAVPEPSTLTLAGIGGLMLSVLVWRKRRG